MDDVRFAVAEADSRDEGLPPDGSSQRRPVCSNQKEKGDDEVQSPLQEVSLHTVCDRRR